MQKSLSDFFNLSRWVAAGAVIVGHVRHLLFADLEKLQHPGLLTKALYFVTGFGHEGVVVFFVVSGYLVGGLSVLKMRTSRFDLADYAIHRFSRIYVVLAPALLLLGGVDLLGTMFVNASGLYTESAKFAPESMNFIVAHNLSIGTLIGNLAMLEGIHGVPRLGSNSPLWSLVYEWWYYCLFAAVAVAATSGRSLRAAVAVAFAIALCLFLPVQILMWGSIWVLGLLVALYGRANLPRPPLWLSLPLFGVTMVLGRFGHAAEAAADPSSWFSLGRDLMVAGGYSAVLLSFHRPGRGLPLAGLHRWLADFSYSLYIVHFPVMVFLAALGFQLFALPIAASPGAGTLAYAAAVLMLLYAFAWAFAFMTERHTQALRRWIARRTGHERRPARGMELVK